MKKSTKRKFQFVCPKHGVLERENVVFLCNKCEQEELIYKDGIYFCPACFNKGQENFMCRICESRRVKMVEVGKK